jgi:UDP-N-acetylmuramoyl-L-alanyl-D-glutamate--2,6-diaminopimelate ligase
VGVTGTDGKTTTSTLLEAILVEATRGDEAPTGRVGIVTTVGARVRGVESDTGLHVTTPDAPDVQRFLAEMCDEGCRYAVVESTSHGLHQRRVGAVEFDVAVVTNITHEHLDYHGTREAYLAAKALLFRALYASEPKAGITRAAILNADDAGSCGYLVQVLAQERVAHPGRRDGVAVRSYSAGPQDAAPQKTGPWADLWATDIVARAEGTSWMTHWWGEPFAMRSPLLGLFNVSNVLAATTAALSLGVEPDVIVRAIAAFPGVLGRMQRMSSDEPFTALVDFAHTPVSLERALETLRPLVGAGEEGAPGRLIAIFGSAGLRDRAKRKWMGQVSGRLADFTIITAEDPRTEDVNDICAEIEAGVREDAAADSWTIIADRTAAIQAGIDMARPGDIVAAFGKGHERSMCYGETEYPWSDQDAMLAALAQRAGREDASRRDG